MGTSDEAGGLRVAVIVGDMRQGQSNRKYRLAVRQRDRMTGGGQKKVVTEEIMQADQADGQTEKKEDMAVVPSGNTFFPHLLSNVCMFA